MKKLILTLLILSSPLALANKGDKSLSGCGLGWKIAPQKSMISMSTRATTNGYTSTFGTTSGTSGCAQYDIVMDHKMDIHMAEASYDELVIEMATGRGENLMAFTRAVGCSDISQSHFAHVVKENYKTISNHGQNPLQLVKTVRSIIRSDAILSRECQII